MAGEYTSQVWPLGGMDAWQGIEKGLRCFMDGSHVSRPQRLRLNSEFSFPSDTISSDSTILWKWTMSQNACRRTPTSDQLSSSETVHLPCSASQSDVCPCAVGVETSLH